MTRVNKARQICNIQSISISISYFIIAFVNYYFILFYVKRTHYLRFHLALYLRMCPSLSPLLLRRRRRLGAQGPREVLGHKKAPSIFGHKESSSGHKKVILEERAKKAYFCDTISLPTLLFYVNKSSDSSASIL